MSLLVSLGLSFVNQYNESNHIVHLPGLLENKTRYNHEGT